MVVARGRAQALEAHAAIRLRRHDRLAASAAAATASAAATPAAATPAAAAEGVLAFAYGFALVR